MEAGASSDAAAAPEWEAAVAGGSGESRAESEEEALLSRAQNLMSKISEAEANPNPMHLHALASILETQESRSISFSFCDYVHSLIDFILL